MNPFFTILSLLVFSFTVQAKEPSDESEILATRGKGVVTQTDFTARANRIPADSRLVALRDRSRLQDVINTMLLRAQLTADAREDGFDKQQLIKDRVHLAAEAELAEAWMQHYVETHAGADYLQLAREYYQLHQQEIMSSPRVDVSHILISNKDRSQQEAFELAVTLSEQLEETPQEFDKLVMQYSEDPSAASNKGRFKNVKKGDMVKTFEETAFALSEGEISGPVETKYGYHLIRLDAHIAPQQISFEEVREQLVEAERNRHEERVKEDYLGGLTSMEVNMTEASLAELINRLFGEDYPDSHVADEDKE
jgi:peptidyl-prolyl cis-trans isomerase C